jgi:hypothetical protein
MRGNADAAQQPDDAAHEDEVDERKSLRLRIITSSLFKSAAELMRLALALESL